MTFIIATLATYYITLILSSYDGPGDVLVRFRYKLPSGLRKGVECAVCCSLYVSILINLFFYTNARDYVISVLAVAGATSALYLWVER